MIIGTARATAKRVPSSMTLREVGTWAYDPHGEPDDLHKADIDMAIVSYSFDGTDDGTVTPEEMNLLKFGIDGSRRLVLCDLALAIADPRRPYWSTTKPPKWVIGPCSNGFRWIVNLMSDEWLAIFDEEVAKVMSAGFDGIFLDCNYPVPLSREIAEHVSRVRKLIENRVLLAANSEHMLAIPGFAEMVDGIAKVDLYSHPDDSPLERQTAEFYLERFAKPVFVVEHAADDDEALRLRQQILQAGWNPCIITPDGFS